MSSSASPRLLSTDDSALDIEISDIENKGRGILALRDFKKGEFVVEYAGDLITIDDAKVNPCYGSGAAIVMILVTLVMIFVIVLGLMVMMVIMLRTNVMVLL